MEKILCYGDSNTFGFDTERMCRFPENQRWSGILKETLKENFEVFEESLCNRNGFVKNPDGKEFCALEHLPVYLKQTFDIIILAVGTNDLQFQYDFDEQILRFGLNKLIQIAKEYSKRIIIVPPVKLANSVLTGSFNMYFNELSIKRSDLTFDLYKQLAEENNCEYFDFNEIAKTCKKDSLHYDAKAHEIIAKHLAKYLEKC